MSRLIYVLNGPNLNLLGKRQPHIYGHETLADVESECRALALSLRLDLRFHQSNREYEIIDWIHEARETAGGIVINREEPRIKASGLVCGSRAAAASSSAFAARVFHVTGGSRCGA